MARKDIDKRIEKATADTTKLINAMQQLRSEGTASASELAKVANEASKLLENYSKLAESVKRSFAQKGNKDQFDKDVKAIESAQKKIRSIQSESQKKYTELTKQEAQKRESIVRELEERSIRNFKRNVERKAQAEKNTRKKIEASNKANTKRVTDFEKRQLDRRAAYYKRKEKEKTAALKKEQKERQDAEKRNDFRGGFGAQFTPRAIGGALGSLTKYLGIYRALAGVMQLVEGLTIGSAKAAIEYEKALANLSAVAGVSSEKTKQLGENAREVAAQTKFSAIEVIGLQTELAKLGFTSDQIIASTKSIAFASQALGSSLSETAATFGKLINQFNLIAEQSEYVGDVLVTTINRSALSFEGFNTAIQYIGPIADQLGFSLEETAGAMAVLADSGFTASRVGTGLRGILTEIGKTSFDAKGELESLAEAHIGLSEAVDLVGKRNAAQLLVLLKNLDAMDDMNDKYYEAGRALESAAIQTNTFDGKMKILQSTIKNFQIDIGSAVTESGFFNTVLSLMSEEAGRTVEGMKAIQGIAESGLGFGAFMDSAERVSGGFDSLQESIELLRASGQITQEQFEMLQGMSYEEIGKFINDSREGYLLWGGSARKENMLLANSVQGLREQLEAQADVLINQESINRGITKGNDDWKDSVDAITESYKQGNDIIDDADALYKQIDARVEELTGKLSENAKASALNKTLTESTRLAYEGEVKALQDLLNILANVTAANKDRNKNNKETIKARKFETDMYDDQIDAMDDYYEKLKTLYDLEGTQVLTGDALLMINKSKSEVYDELISRLEATREGIEKEKNATDQSTEAGKKKAEVHQKELENLDKLIKKYKEKKDALSEDLGVMKEIFSQGQKDLKDAQNMDATGDVKIDAQNKIIERLSAQLLEAAGDDPILKEIAEEYIKGLQVSLGEEADKVDWLEILSNLNQALSKAIQDYNATALENRKAYLNRELDAIKEKYKIEEDILKSSLNNQLITQSQYRVKQEELRKKQLREEDDIKRQIFEQEKKIDLRNTTIETLEALASNALNNFERYDTITAGINTTIGYGIILAAGAAKADSIRRREYVGAKFEQGGMVEGPSHAQGGIPFSVQGQGGYEMEGGEFIVNKKAASLHRQLLESINNSVKPTATVQPMKFATGGIVNNTIVNNTAGESVNYLKAIAEATTSTAIQTSKPVRAFVTDRDLRTSETERRLRDRNSRL